MSKKRPEINLAETCCKGSVFIGRPSARVRKYTHAGFGLRGVCFIVYCIPMGKSRKRDLEDQFNAGLGLRPRHYVQRVIEKKTRDERRAELDLVPNEYRVWVESSVRDHFDMGRKRIKNKIKFSSD